MSTKVPLLTELLLVIEELLHTAKQLAEASSRSIAPEEVEALEQKQEALIEEIKKYDERIQAKGYSTSQDENELEKKIQKRLLEFQKINNTFFHNLENKLGLIRFSKNLQESSSD